MVRLVHTADVHLDPDAPERREALAGVLDRAEAVDADAVTIGGDLFEDETAAERLRPELRSLLSDRPFPVVAIPGNHDSAAFGGDAFFGSAFRAVTVEPFEHVSVADGRARVTCVPYSTELTDELLVALAEREPIDGLDVLLLHCSLAAPSMDAAVGDESATRYCPVTRNELGALGFDVVLAGHYHGGSVTELPGEDGATGAGETDSDGSDAGDTAHGVTGPSDTGTFVYPGTPASVTRSEIGRRSIAIVDGVATPTVTLEPIDAFHYDELQRTVRPGEAEAVLEAVRDRVDAWDGRRVEARVAIDGFVDRDETDFADELAAACEDVPYENRTRSVAHLLEHPIYREFVRQLDAVEPLDASEGDDYDPERLREDARKRVLAAMADLAAEGELS